MIDAALLELERTAMDVHNLSGRMHRQLPTGQDFRFDIHGNFEASGKYCDAIRQTPGPSEKTNEELGGGRLHLDFIFRQLGQAITVAERSNAGADWIAVQDECSNAIIALDEIQKKLKTTL